MSHPVPGQGTGKDGVAVTCNEDWKEGLGVRGGLNLPDSPFSFSACFSKAGTLPLPLQGRVLTAPAIVLRFLQYR